MDANPIIDEGSPTSTEEQKSVEMVCDMLVGKMELDGGRATKYRRGWGKYAGNGSGN